MADRFVFDLDAEYPDVLIDTLRRAVVAAIADLQVHADQLDASLLLVETTYDVAQTFLTTVLGIQAGGATLQDTVTAMGQALTAQAQELTTQAEELAAAQQAIAALTARVDALENPPAPVPDPTTGGTA